MGSISSGQLGFPNPLNRVQGKSIFRSSSKSPVGSGSISEGASAGDSVSLNPVRINSFEAARKSVFMEINVRTSQAILNIVSRNGDKTSVKFNFESIEVYGRSSTGKATDGVDDAERVQNPMAKLQELFSPENTANRILDFALSYYGFGRFATDDSSENRAVYRDFIFPAIEKGFQEALSVFGELPQDILDQIHETLAKVQVGFENFVAGSDDSGSGELPEIDFPVPVPEAG